MKFYIALLITLSLVSFKPGTQEWNSAIILKCNTAKDIGYLTAEEKGVIFYLNLVRVNPNLFARTYLKNYLDTAPIKKSVYLESLQNELESMSPVDIVEPQYDLYEVAKKHATEMGIQGKTGHVSLSGESYEKRAINLSKRYLKAMENCQYGYKEALSIVIDLLIDEDIPDLSHRKSLLNSDVKYVGVAIKKHKVYRYNCVIEMGYELKHP
jgi:hypothetical protein